MTADKADLALLSLANEKGKFGIELEMTLEDSERAAFERGIDHQWFTFVDISTIATAPGPLMRIFRLTDAGTARLKQLKPQRTIAP